MDHEIVIYIEEYRAKSDYKTFLESFSISRNANLFITMFFLLAMNRNMGGGFICKAFFILGQGHEYHLSTFKSCSSFASVRHKILFRPFFWSLYQIFCVNGGGGRGHLVLLHQKERALQQPFSTKREGPFSTSPPI